MMYKIKPLFWDMNEQTGYRHITLENNGDVLFVVAANKYDNKWTASAVPMGFRMSIEQAVEFSGAFKVLPDLMTFLERDEISVDEIQNYLLTLNS